MLIAIDGKVMVQRTSEFRRQTVYGVTSLTTAESFGLLDQDTVVILLDGQETAGGYEWQEVSVDGQVGWVAVQFLEIPASAAAAPTATP